MICMFKYFGFGDNNDLHAEVQRWKKVLEKNK